jgi:uncharacterized membrane protein
MKRFAIATGVGTVVIFGACSLPWVGLLTDRVVGDMPLFGFYGERMARGLIPYRDFYFDWAPGSVPPVVFPAWIGGNYKTWFHVLACIYGVMAVASLAATLMLLRVGRRRLFAAVVAAAALPAALGAISINSIDYWPALFTGVAIAALVAGRDKLGCAFLGAGIAAKVYPLVLLPLAMIWVWRRHGRRAALQAFGACAGVVAVAAGSFFVLAPGGVGYSTYLQFKRGLQMESLGASVLMALDHLGLLHVHVIVGKPYSLDIAGAPAAVFAAVLTVVLAVALVMIYTAYAAAGDTPQRFVTASVAAVTAYIIFGRVLSPQYLVWLFPLVPLLAGSTGFAATGLLFAACALTMTWFPGRFFHLAAVSQVSWFVLARNVLLVALFVVVARRVLASAEQPLRETLARGRVLLHRDVADPV